MECAFGVLQRKFQILTQPLEKWDENQIGKMVTTCFILHNMMVQQQLDGNDSDEDFQGIYNLFDTEEIQGGSLCTAFD